MSETPCLSLHQITKRLGDKAVLHSLSLELFCGELCLLLGRNGSGKSTLLKTISGLMTPEEGEITTTITSSLPHTSYFGHQLMLYEQLTVSEHIDFYLKLSGAEASVTTLAHRWQLEPCLDLMVKDLSKGQTTRLALLRTFIKKTPLVLLDEPTSHLDDSGIKVLLAQIKELQNAGSAVIIATHDLLRLKEAASRLLVLERGEITFDTSLGEATLQERFMRAISFYQETNR